MNAERIQSALESVTKIEAHARKTAQASADYAESVTRHREALKRIVAEAQRMAQEYGDLADAAADQAGRFRAMLQDLERGTCPCCGQPTGDNGRVSADLGDLGFLQ